MKPQGGLESDVLLLLRGPTTINITARSTQGGLDAQKYPRRLRAAVGRHNRLIFPILRV